MKTTACLRAIVGTALTSVAAAQSFNYADFTSTAGITLNGQAASAGTALRVTPSLTGTKGSAWYATPVAVSGNFDMAFAFQITAPVSTGADGLTFAIHNDPRGATALGDGGSVLGYGHDTLVSPPTVAINNSLVVELDTYFNTGDLSGNEISVQTGGAGVNGAADTYSIGRITPTINMSDGLIHTLRVTYVPGTLKVYLDNLTSPLLTIPYDFSTGGTQIVPNTPVGGLNLIGGTSAYVGFTSATGGAWENHDVLSWNWNSCPAPLVYCTAKVNSLGCTPTIGAMGSASATAGSGFIVTCTHVRNNKNGLLFYGVTGPSGVPYQGGTLCVKAPIKRTPSVNSGGASVPTNNCSGVYAIDMNAFAVGAIGGSPLATLTVPGTVVNCQWWGRDPGFAPPFNTTLSDGQEYIVCP
jgi:hypothetical protein